MRLIDADALEKSLTEKGDGYKVSMFATSDDCNIARIVAFECAEEVKNAPTIEAEHVRNGRWILNEDGKWACSYCEGVALEPPDEPETWQALTVFCPHCGAKMDGGTNDGHEQV